MQPPTCGDNYFRERRRDDGVYSRSLARSLAGSWEHAIYTDGARSRCSRVESDTDLGWYITLLYTFETRHVGEEARRSGRRRGQGTWAIGSSWSWRQLTRASVNAPSTLQQSDHCSSTGSRSAHELSGGHFSDIMGELQHEGAVGWSG